MKDPAVLFYISDWLTSTKEMKADERGWFLNLILHQYDKGSLPNDIEELANLADVRFSEFVSFQAKWEQVLKQKFKQNDLGRLENDRVKDILQRREKFVEKRSSSGTIGYIIKFAKNELNCTTEQLFFLKENLDFTTIETKDKQVLIQVLKQTLKLYRNGNEIENKDEKVNKKVIPEISEFLQHASTLITNHAEYEFVLTQKYNSWVEAKWKDGNGKEIKNWKTKLANTIPYLKPFNPNGKPNNTGRETPDQYKSRVGKELDDIFTKKFGSGGNDTANGATDNGGGFTEFSIVDERSGV
jgi:uncharacterized protein YdaU (DUF1376 family)